MNLKKETLQTLKICGKTPNDIRWIGTKYEIINIDKFWELADTEYDESFGAQEVASDLIIVGDDWWLERESYDGNEYWRYHFMPKKPIREMSDINALTVRQYNEQNVNYKVGWRTLAELNPTGNTN